ncbi:T9SS C-terminal target domain-containing protein [Flavobacterium sp. KJJ]|uniref:T9SS C-terminal target domain-containing protein n=1 Tax=Flavobacterium sp. KJJ TaxID=1270193 RepID=UPI00049355C6|nr:T9SS C-terminal target domain-containing protein [Flavobacterium sp. KJJ]
MKKTFTFCDLIYQKRLLGLLLLLLFCNNSFAQTFCRPVSNTNSISGICIGSSVTNPTAAYDNDPGFTTFATLSTVVGAFCSAQETLVLNQTAKAGDQIALYIGNGSGLLNLSLLSTGTIQAKLNGTNVGSSVAINNPLLNLTILPGNTIGVLKYTLTGDANQVQIQLGGVVSVLTDLRIYDVRLDFAAPTVTGELNQTICSGNSATLTATPASGTTVAWYSSATSTTALATTNSYTTPSLTANTTYYIGVTRAAGCEGNERIPVVVNVSNPIAPVVSSSGTAICSTGATQQTTLSVINPIPGTTYNWYSVISGGPVLASGNFYSPTVPVGTTSFYVEAAIGGCVSPTRTQVDVISTAVPSPATALTQSVTIQSGQNATLNATTAQAGVTINWYDVATGGTALATNTSTYTTPILTASKTYYAETQSATGGCVSATRVPITVTVITTPPGGCLEANSQQTTLNGLCLLCGSTNPNNSVDGNIATAARLTVPVGLINGWIQQTLQFNNPGKAGDIVDVELELPGGLADVALLGAVSLATYNGATYNSDRVLINNPLITLQLLSGNRFKASVTAGANFDRVEVRLGGLATVLTSLDIYQASYRYKVPTISGNTTVCSGQSTTLTASLGVGETANWYSTATGGTSLVSTAAFTTPNLTTATTYYVEITRNGCVNSERSPIQVLVNNPIAPTVSASPSSVCAGQSTTITVQAPVAGTTYNWYDAAAAGNLVFTGTSFATPALTASTSYYVEAVIGSCSSPAPRSQVTITVNPLPAVPTVASTTVIIPSGQVVTLQVSNPVTGIAYDWYTVPTGGTAVATNATSYTPSPALTANTSYYISARDAATGCTSLTRTVINVMVTPPAPITSCLQANNQTTSNDGIICIGCGAVGGTAGLSVDGNNNTAATLQTPITLGGYVQQKLDFATSGVAGDIIEVELGLPTGILDISALSYITLQSYNGGADNADGVSISSLGNVQLLGGNRFRASFAAGANFTGVQVRLGGLVSVLRELDIYGASFKYKEALITGAAAPICSGGQTTLTATTTGGDVLNWYTVPSGGGAFATNTGTINTGALTTTTTYYIEAVRGGTCINSVRQPVTVTVLPLALASDITIASPITSNCDGTAVLSPTSTLPGAQFSYYLDTAKTKPVTTSSSYPVDQPGITFTKNTTTGALTVNGLSSGVSYTYYLAVSNATTCENSSAALVPVIVNYPATTSTLAVTTPFIACGSANLTNAIVGYVPNGNTTYTFFDPSNNVITADAAANITVSGIYSIQAQTTGFDCPSARQTVDVTVNPLPTLTVDPAQSVNTGSSVALNATSNATSLVWYDPQGNSLGNSPANTGVLNTPGIYTYTVVATLGGCSRTGTLSINVKDPDNCQLLTERVYANSQTSGSIVTGGVSNGGAAIDGNPQTFSTITTGLGLLGIGTTWQDLKWSANIVKGTPVTIKLGSEYSGVALAQNLSVIGTKAGVDIGTLQSVSGSLLNLLSGDNSYEFTFVPSNASGPQDYDGVRIQSASLLSVAQNTKVFDAYYSKPVTTATCTPGDIEDVFYGATDLGLPVGAVTAAVGVSDAWNVADNDVTTFATMYSGLNVLSASDLMVEFKTPSVVSDTLRIVVSKPGLLLDVNLLTGFTIQRYLGNVAVGAPIQNTSTLLSLRLLPGNTMAMVLVSSPSESYDRIRIRLGGVASVLDLLRVHTVERVGNTKVIGSDPTNKIAVCPGSDITLQIAPEACADYKWYDTLTGGTALATGSTFTVPSTLAAGIYKYYVQPVRYGCESYARGLVTVEVKASSPENLITNITLNGAASTTICSPTGTVTLTTSLNTTETITNPVYHWYSFDGTTSQPIAGATGSSLTVNGLTAGTYTYYVGFSSDEYCETATADRKQITFTILRPSDQNDLSVNDIAICHDLPVVITPTATLLTNPLFTWYLDINKTQPITNGAVINGVTYTISASGVLTASGITLAMSPISYYVGVSSDTTCENVAGTLQSATVIITDPGTPTLVTAGTQNFCLVNAPTFASIQFNQANIVWYDALTGGNSIASTTALTSGVYFAAIKDPATTCESAARLQVTVNVTDPGTPTLVNAGTQNFCLVNAPTFASVQFNQANIVWYDALTGGNSIASTTALTSGVYFAAIKDPITNCESAARLQVTVNVNDPGTPTLVNAGTQNFCLVNAPTFASVQFNQANIVWYDALIGGNSIASTTALTSGVYFAAIKDPATTCESAARLQVTVNVNDPGTPTLVTAGTQNFCLVNTPTFASIRVNEANVVWYSAAIGGTAFASTTALTAGTYYGAIKDPITGCESTTRLQVAVTITDPAKPTTTNTAQVFCSGTLPTVASIQVNEANVVWYSASTGGTAIPSTTALATGVYYGAIKDPATGCESSVRLQINVTVGNTINPTTNNSAQSFCTTASPTIASIQVNQSNVTWFSSATGGTAIPSTTALTSGIYYGNIVDVTTGCESSTRLQVTVTVTSPAPTPTTNNATQNFCSINSPTVANIQVNEANVIWYSTATGGTAIPATTPLATGTYYGVVSSAISCENLVRLAVAVNVNTPSIITTPRTNQTFCLSAAPTIANILVNEANVVWYASATGGTPLAANTPLIATTYYAGALSNTTNGCDSATRLAITVSFENDALVPITSNDDTPCVFQGVTYSIANGKSNYVWSITNGTIVSGGGTADGNVTVSWSDIGPGKVTVTYINTCNETTTKTLNVTVATCSDLTITNTVSNPTPNFGEEITFTITVNNVGQGNIINTIVSDLLPSGYDLVSTSTTSGTYDPLTGLWTIPTLNAGQSVVLTIVAEVLPGGDYLNVATIEISTPLDIDAANNTASASVEPICLTVYNEFTPNNDGANDLFRIDCIESYPNNELKVYNRYGALVYSKKGYENDWNGTANVSGVINRGDMLPTGTYFYVIDIGNGTVKKGWLSIMR